MQRDLTANFALVDEFERFLQANGAYNFLGELVVNGETLQVRYERIEASNMGDELRFTMGVVFIDINGNSNYRLIGDHKFFVAYNKDDLANVLKCWRAVVEGIKYGGA